MQKENSPVHLCEVGLRDGFQFIDRWIPSDFKFDLAKKILASKLDEVQLTSFVRKDLVPQMADAKELVEAYNASNIDPNWKRAHVLVLNRKGLELARKAGARAIEISISSNEEHGQKNAKMSVRKGLSDAVAILSECREDGIRVRAGVQCVFGYIKPGDTEIEQIEMIVARLAEYRPSLISLADTTGMANPNSIDQIVQASRIHCDDISIGCHLHDTRGLGLLNAYQAWKNGVRSFDSSLAGMGGCPFVKGAAGNIATEDLVYLFNRTGIDRSRDHSLMSEIAIGVEDYLGMSFPGKVHQVKRLEDSDVG